MCSYCFLLLGWVAYLYKVGGLVLLACLPQSACCSGFTPPRWQVAQAVVLESRSLTRDASNIANRNARGDVRFGSVAKLNLVLHANPNKPLLQKALA